MTANETTPQAELLKRIVAWAHNTDHVRALVQTGSFAREDALADAHSDLDIEIISDQLERLEGSINWIKDIAPPLICLPFDRPAQDWATRLVIFADGVKADFTLASPVRIAAMKRSGQLDDIYERGYRVLIDKSGLCAEMPARRRGYPHRSLPMQPTFTAAVEEFWFEAWHIPKYLARDELFLMQQRAWTMRELLLQMIEWHALAHNPDTDIWHNGARLADWADPSILRDLPRTFSNCQTDLYAFRATTVLYARIARETAAAAGLSYPAEIEAAIRAMIG